MANTVDKVIKIAEAEVGYLEKESNKYLDSKTKNAGDNNFTKYWKALKPSWQRQPWCNAYVNWIFIEAYGTKEAKELLCTPGEWSYYTPTSANYFKKKGQWHTKNPKVGDVIFFKNTVRICHVGIVYKVDDNYVYTIEGNTSSSAGVVANGGGVFKKKYVLNYKKIAGYGRPKYDVVKTCPYTKITKDSSETAIKWMQKKLNACYTGKLKDLEVDGVWGDKTQDMLEAYWKQLGWDKGTYCGKKTCEALWKGRKK